MTLISTLSFYVRICTCSLFTVSPCLDFFSCRFCCFSCRALACTRAIAAISLGRVSELGFLFRLLLLLMGTFLAFRARRDVWVLVLAIISEFGRFVRSEPSFGLTKLRAICVIVALTVTISLVGLPRQITEQQQGFSETFQWIQSHTY
jgi:hypothetical protein